MERSLQIIACCLVVLSCGAPVPEQDGGLVDAGYGAVDAGRDTNSSDSGALDAGVDGGAAADAGVLDAGVIDGGVLDAGVTPATLCSNLARQRCGFFVRCSSEEPISDGGDNNRLAASEQAACETLLAVEPACVKAAEGWSKGRSTFDSGGYLACLGSLPSTSCGRDVLLARACRAIPYLRPATPLGALCTRDAECLDGWCSATPLACGACMSYLSPTTHCSRDAQCEPLGFYCPGADTSTGASGLPCAPRKLAGAQCRTGTLAQNAQEEECAPGLVCAKPGGIWQCTAAKALNTPCQKGAFECFRSGRGVNETVCTTTLEPDGGTSSRCAPFHMQLGSTTPCFAGETENIFDSPNAPVCPEDMYCSSWFCQPRLGAGTTCTSTEQCQAGASCQVYGASKVCVPYGDVGHPCELGSQNCKSLLQCRGNGGGMGGCEPAYAIAGEVCAGGFNWGRLCAGGVCQLDPDGGIYSSCRPLKADGDVCASAEECGSHVCRTDGGTGVCLDRCG